MYVCVCVYFHLLNINFLSMTKAGYKNMVQSFSSLAFFGPAARLLTPELNISAESFTLVTVYILKLIFTSTSLDAFSVWHVVGIPVFEETFV